MGPVPAETDTSALCTLLVLSASCGLCVRKIQVCAERHHRGADAVVLAGSGQGAALAHIYTFFACDLLECQRWSCCWCWCSGRGEGDMEELLTETVVKSLLSSRQQRTPCLLSDATKFSLALDAERPWACCTSYVESSWHCRTNMAGSSHLLVLHEQREIFCFFRFVYLCLICFSKPVCYL